MKVCPSCYSEMISRSGFHVCPRNEIGDCRFNGYDRVGESFKAEPSRLIERNDTQPSRVVQQ